MRLHGIFLFFARSGLAGAAVLAAGVSPAIVEAQTTPRQVRIAYASADATSDVSVTWSSDSNTTQVVQFGIAAVGENELTASVTSPLGGGLGYVHSVVMSDLVAETTYKYRVGSDADGWSPDTGNFTFETGPTDPCAPFTFVALGDTRGESYLSTLSSAGSNWENVFDRLVADDPRFVLIAGDLVDDGNAVDQWNSFFNQGTQHYTWLPVMPAFGNHDGGGSSADNYELLYTLPENPKNNEHYYHFVYGNVLVIAFNSDRADLFSEQQTWMEQVLINNPATWKIVYFHHPVWTTTPGETEFGCLVCGHPPDEKGQNDLLIDLVDRYDIDIVFQSHNHFYERSHPMVGGGGHESKVTQTTAYRGTTSNPSEWGSLYILSGGGGATLVPLSWMGGLQLMAPGQAAIDDKYHYMRFSVADLQLIVDAVKVDGTILDTVTITKQSQYRAETCAVSPPADDDEDGYDASVDCDDTNAEINPGATEICGDTIDQDCVGGDLACPSDDGGPTGGDAMISGGGDSDTPGGAPEGGCDCSGTVPTGWWILGLGVLASRRRGLGARRRDRHPSRSDMGI